MLASACFPSCFLTFFAVINPYSLFKFIILNYSCTYVIIYGLAIDLANYIVSENICLIELHCYSMHRKKLFIY